MEGHDIAQDTGSKAISKEKKCKRAKWLSEKDLQIAVKRKEGKRSEKQMKKGKISPFEHRVPKNSKER